VLLREYFGTEPFTIEDAEFYTLTETRYRDEGHLGRLGLLPLQEAGQLRVIDSTRRRRTDFPKKTVMKLMG
jgi:hypothetical protein